MMTRGWGRLASAAAVAVLVAASTGLAGAVQPPPVPPGPAPPDPPPAPDRPMRQVAGCTRTAAIPGSDFRELPPALQLMNMPAAWSESTGAGVVVAVIDTGVTPSPRLPHLVAGGDYVMGPYGDGLSDCDAHGTVIASLIGGAPSGARLPIRPRGAALAVPPPGAPPPQPIPPPPPPPTVTVTSTATPAPVTVQVPAPPPPPLDAPNWITSGGAVPRAPVPLRPARGGGPDGLIGVAPDAVIVSIRQSSHTFGPVDPGLEADPEAAQRAGDINSLARAVVHAANMGAKVINISVVACLPAAAPADQTALGAALRYAAVDRDAVIVTAAGNAGEAGCKQNPDPVPADRTDPLGWNSVTTIATPAWFSDYVLSVSATDSMGVPLSGQAASLHGPWVGLAAPGADIVGLSTGG
ncbi:MAG TPA: S8 family serine peptidase, partial [Mycobacterium sp.]|nr:S8 family serine peptidase [Mycobacterium sp.]